MPHTMPDIRERLESLPCMSAPKRTGELHSANAVYTVKNLIFYCTLRMSHLRCYHLYNQESHILLYHQECHTSDVINICTSRKRCNL